MQSPAQPSAAAGDLPVTATIPLKLFVFLNKLLDYLMLFKVLLKVSNHHIKVERAL